MIPIVNQLSDDIVAQLPDEMQQMVLAEQEKQSNIISALQTAISKKRDDAVKYRSASGIETEWVEDEEFYEGIDDANRGEPRMIKPYHPSGVVTTVRSRKKTKSTIFMNITRQYVDSAAASVSELGNPTDDRNFMLRPTPDAELEDEKGSTTPNPAKPQQTIGDFVESELSKAIKSALLAQTQIDDWLVNCNWHAGMRKAVHNSAKVGTGIMKGPFPEVQKRHKTTATKNAEGKTEHGLVIEHEICPASKVVSVWNLYPDPACGDSIHKGNHLIEHDSMNGRQLRELKELPGYIASQIDKILEEGPRPSSNDASDKNKPLRQDTYDVWYYYGLLKREEIKAMSIPDALDENDPLDKKALVKIEQMEAMPCVATMVNDVLIKASLNPLDSGEFPYDLIVWEKREGSPWGRGISRIMRPAQRIVNAAVRNLMDNAALSGGIQMAFRKGKVKPMGGGAWQMNSIGFWEITDEEVTDIKQAISFAEIPSRQQEIMAIIQFGQKMAEDITGMPLLLQGQSGSAPDTVGGMQMLNNNATATRRMIARQIDDDFTEPHIRRYYNWILMYGDESMKGNMTIDARGSQALVERDIARQYADRLLQYSKDPAYGINPKKAMEGALKAQNMVPSDVQYTEAEIKQQQSQQAPAAPAVQAAQIRVASAEKIEAAKEANDQKIAQIEAKATVDAVQQRTARDDEAMRIKIEADFNMRKEELALEREIAMLKYATEQHISLNTAKTQLAQTTMKLQTEKELAASASALELAAKQTEHATSVHAAAQDTIGQIAAQAHEKAIQSKQHQHEIDVANLKPEVQVPGRAGNGNELNQMPKV